MPNQVYTRLKDEILSLKIKPGQSIGEIEIANRFNVSRTPVRDAFKRLEYENLLEIRAHKGTSVTLIDINYITDIIYIREKLEFAVIQELCKNCTENKQFQLNLLLTKQNKLFEQGYSQEELAREFIKSDNEFHAMLFKLANKENVLSFITSISHHYERFRMFINIIEENILYELFEEHKLLAECIVTNNIEKLQEVFKEHLYNGIRKSSEKVFEYPEYFTDIK
ncbi:GntR family transcriptional regulator [Natranaerovirga pectinivora]|uniref:GntR family transcriptional regulator n=1 Tax=Natranaerovirga pectinivora TaxID=682400 RepID=A0A4R3MRW0_9FIRM|nr:GntR family transcriptional regulator [Natranaerovirga pectinivora]TCT15527.1 GntR family transcriptional regulator [Natranaerovirga pectinivora]